MNIQSSQGLSIHGVSMLCPALFHRLLSFSDSTQHARPLECIQDSLCVFSLPSSTLRICMLVPSNHALKFQNNPGFTPFACYDILPHFLVNLRASWPLASLGVTQVGCHRINLSPPTYRQTWQPPQTFAVKSAADPNIMSCCRSNKQQHVN